MREEAEREAYWHGLDDMWEAAKKVYLPIEDGGFSESELKAIFGTISVYQTFKECSTPVIVEHIIAYEEQKNKKCTACKYQNDTDGSECYECVKGMVDRYEPTESIKVGDEVTYTDMGINAVVLDIVDDNERIMVYNENAIVEDWRIDSVRKTGHTFKQIAEVLKQLQEGKK